MLANPPYVKLDHLGDNERKFYTSYLAAENVGRIDSYIAFMKLCLEMVEEGGFVCLVLPQVFLLAKNAAFLRQKIFKSFDVRCLVDLSAVSVFEKVGTYSILLVLQKRIAYTPENPPAHIAKRDLTQTIEETEIDSRNPERLPWASAACAAVARI